MILIAAECAELGRLVRRAHGSQAPVTRAPASVLAGAEPGASNTAVARARVSAGPASARGTPAGTHAELEAASRGYLQETNQQPRPLVWTKTADAILASVGRFCQHTSNPVH